MCRSHVIHTQSRRRISLSNDTWSRITKRATSSFPQNRAWWLAHIGSKTLLEELLQKNHYRILGYSLVTMTDKIVWCGIILRFTSPYIMFRELWDVAINIWKTSTDIVMKKYASDDWNHFTSKRPETLIIFDIAERHMISAPGGMTVSIFSLH